MKIIKLITISISVLFIISSCAQKRSVQAPRPEVDRSLAVFAKAQSLYDRGEYASSLVYYNEYLENFTGGGMTDAALLKKAKILVLLDRLSEAENTYKKIIYNFPNSSFMPDAATGVLQIPYEEADYLGVVRQADTLLDIIRQAPPRVIIYVYRGDALKESGFAMEALKSYAMAYEIAGARGRAGIDGKITAVLPELSPDDMIGLADDADYESMRGELLFFLGKKYADTGEDVLAMEALGRFVAEYPENRNASEAHSLMKFIEEKPGYGIFTIGCLLPVSGKYEAFGAKALRGIEMAMATMVPREDGPSLRIVVHDTAADPARAQEGVKKLAAEGVSVIIGPMVTAQAAAVQAQKEKIPMIALSQRDAVCRNGDYIFNNFLTPEMQARAVAEYAFKRLNVKRVAILYPDEKYGTTFMNLFWDRVVEYGGEVAGAEAYQSNQTDFAESVKKIVGLHYKIPDYLKEPEENVQDVSSDEEEPESIVDFQAVFIPDSAAMAGLMLPQLSFFDVDNVYLLGTNLWHSRALIDRAGREAQGAVFSEGFFAGSGRPEVREFVQGFNEFYGSDPGFIEAVSYDTARIVLKVAEGKKGGNIRDRIAEIEGYEGVTGLTSFNGSGSAQKELYLLTVRGKEFVELP